MIVVRVELHSAITHRVTEIARMAICNDGTSVSETKGNYRAQTFRGRSKVDLDRNVVSKSGELQNYPRKALHVWNLVARMLKTMDYTK